MLWQGSLSVVPSQPRRIQHSRPHQIKIGLKHTYDVWFSSIWHWPYCDTTCWGCWWHSVRKHSSQSSTCSSPPPAKPNSPLVNKLRPHRHDCSLTVESDARNFITRQLFKDMCQLTYSYFKFILPSYCRLLRFVNFSLNIWWWWWPATMSSSFYTRYVTVQKTRT